MAEEFTDIEDFDINCHSEIQQDFSDPDFSENGTDYWEHYRFEVEKGQVLLRIDKYLVERIKGTSRNRIQNAAEAQCIRVNGKPVKSNYRVHPGEIITVVMDRLRYENEIIAQDIPIDIVYEDDALLVVNKPAGMCVHPGHGNYDGTLVNALAWHFKDNPNYDVTDPRMGLVHRIDKDTSGPAELFACDMRDFGKAKLVGTATKGNGTMQRVYQLSDGGAVKLTVAEIKPYTSDVYNGVGLTPDYLVELSSQKKNRLALLSHSEDEQYQKANSLLTSSAGADEQ